MPRYQIVLGMGRGFVSAETRADARAIAMLEAADKVVDNKTGKVIWSLR